MKITAGTLTNGTLTLILDDGAQILTARNDHPKWNEIIEAFKSDNANKLISLISLKSVIEDYTVGMLSINGTGVTYAGKPIHTIDAERVMAFLRDGLPYKPIANYIERKMANPSSRAINEMYNFLEHKNMPLTDKGTFIAYKGVSEDFYSITGNLDTVVVQGTINADGKILNAIGSTIEVQRSSVDDDFRNGCSHGLHAGSLSYAAGWGKKVILVEIDPADVVSIPEDCSYQKLRCCKYKVVGEYTGPLPDHYINEFSSDDDTDEDYDDDDDDDANEVDDTCDCDECNPKSIPDSNDANEVDDTCDCDECNPKIESESTSNTSYEGCNDYNPPPVEKENLFKKFFGDSKTFYNSLTALSGSLTGIGQIPADIKCKCSCHSGEKVDCGCHVKCEYPTSQAKKPIQTKEVVENKIRELYSKHFNVSTTSIRPSTTIVYLGANMNEWIEFCNAVEEEFTITIPKPLTLLQSTFERFVKYVQSRILAKNDMKYIKYCLTELGKHLDEKVSSNFTIHPLYKDITLILVDVFGVDKKNITSMVTGIELKLSEKDIEELCFCLEDRYRIHIPEEMSTDILTIPFYDIVARVAILIRAKQVDESSDHPYWVGRMIGASDFTRGLTPEFLHGDEDATDSEDHCEYIKGYLKGYNI